MVLTCVYGVVVMYSALGGDENRNLDRGLVLFLGATMLQVVKEMSDTLISTVIILHLLLLNPHLCDAKPTYYDYETLRSLIRGSSSKSFAASQHQKDAWRAVAYSHQGSFDSRGVTLNNYLRELPSHKLRSSQNSFNKESSLDNEIENWFPSPDVDEYNILDKGNALEDYGDTDDKSFEKGSVVRAPSFERLPRTVPQYMIDIYNKFSNKKYTTPVFNIVRSFMNVNQEIVKADGFKKIKNNTRIHRLVFNITSISRDEDINLAEVRLYTLVEKDRNTYIGVDRKVSVYQVIPIMDSNESEQKIELLSTKRIFGRNSGWETFKVTSAVHRWIHTRASHQILEVRIESMLGGADGLDVDISTAPRHVNEPLLIVYSNDRKKRKLMAKEIHEMISHEMSSNTAGEDIDHVISDYRRQPKLKPNRDASRLLVERSVQRNRTAERFAEKRKPSSIFNKGAILKQSFSSGNRTTRGNRYKRRARRYRRNICRRKPMYVNFQDINWDSWIIAPKGYQAFECTGRCYFPLSDHLTPTKHAIIQTLLNANYPRKASRTCCVPTKLDPISILYLDEQNIVTYKYKYDGMIVAECGCR